MGHEILRDVGSDGSHVFGHGCFSGSSVGLSTCARQPTVSGSGLFAALCDACVAGACAGLAQSCGGLRAHECGLFTPPAHSRRVFGPCTTSLPPHGDVVTRGCGPPVGNGSCWCESFRFPQSRFLIRIGLDRLEPAFSPVNVPA